MMEEEMFSERILQKAREKAGHMLESGEERSSLLIGKKGILVLARTNDEMDPLTSFDLGENSFFIGLPRKEQQK